MNVLNLLVVHSDSWNHIEFVLSKAIGIEVMFYLFTVYQTFVFGYHVSVLGASIIERADFKGAIPIVKYNW